MKKGKVTNIMADGSICEDLSTYIDEDHPLPELAARIIRQFILEGYEELERQRRGQ